MELRRFFVSLLISLAVVFALNAVAQPVTKLLNVSYDPTREFYEDYNKHFMAFWKQQTGNNIRIQQSHGGSGAQARAVLDGLEADVVTLALAYDIDVLADKAHLLPVDWQTKLPHFSCPYTSTIVLLVRNGNPKQIQDWSDLIRPDVKVITPNPKTSGGARWNYLAAWGYAIKKYHGDEALAQRFMTRLFKNVPILDTGARGATNSFVQRGIGDVLIAWENEALMVINKVDQHKFTIIMPSITILTEPPVTVVEAYAKRKGTMLAANAYLEHLYSPEGQDIIAQHYFRPTNTTKYQTKFPKVVLMTIRDFGGWKVAQKKFFDEGGLFDQIYQVALITAKS